MNSRGELLGIIAVATIAILFAMSVAGPGSRFGNTWSYLTNGSSAGNSQVPATGPSIVGGPSISTSKIDSILSAAGSPAAGTGYEFTLDSAEYDIDSAYALAFFHHESSYGTSGVASQTHSIGNIRCTSGYSCIGGFRAYSSWSAGIDDWFALIKNEYVSQGLTTVSQIVYKYAPSADGNDPSSYAASVESDVSTWRTAQ